LFLAGRWLLGIYLAHSNVGSAYGAAGSLALILVWLYYSGMILLLGAELTQAWARTAEERPEPRPAPAGSLRRSRQALR